MVGKQLGLLEIFESLTIDHPDPWALAQFIRNRPRQMRQGGGPGSGTARRLEENDPRLRAAVKVDQRPQPANLEGAIPAVLRRLAEQDSREILPLTLGHGRREGDESASPIDFQTREAVIHSPIIVALRRAVGRVKS